MGLGIQRQPPDSYLDAVAKLVPGEVLVAYFAALRVPGIGGERVYHLALLVVLAALSPALLALSARRIRSSAPWLQYVVRAASFTLVATSADPVLALWPSRLQWVASVGCLAVILLAAAILAPPSTQPPRR